MQAEIKTNSSQSIKLEKKNFNTIKIGKYRLEYPKDHRKKKPIHKEIMKELKDQEKDILDLSWGKYKRFRWDKVFKYIKQSDIERISAYGNTDKRMLIEISRVNFNNLTYLDLRDCQLQNIETLPSGPTLNFLSLANNNIYTVKSLKKCQLSSLKTLLLNDNPISILELQRCNFQLETFWLQRKFNLKTIQESLSQTSLFKLNQKSMKDISIESSKRVYQGISVKKIHQKYLSLERLLYIDPDSDDFGQIEFINYLSDSDEDIVPFENEEQDEDIEINPPALHNVQGQDEQDWLSEVENVHQIQENNDHEDQCSDESWEQ